MTDLVGRILQDGQPKFHFARRFAGFARSDVAAMVALAAGLLALAALLVFGPVLGCVGFH